MPLMTDRDYEKLWDEARSDPSLDGHPKIDDWWVKFIKSIDEKIAEGKYPLTEKQKAKIVEFHDMIIKGTDNENEMTFGNGISAKREDRRGFVMHLNGKPVGGDHTPAAAKAVGMFLLNYADEIHAFVEAGGGAPFADDNPEDPEFDDQF